jgi:mono/diheme cytochrome c family protein
MLINIIILLILLLLVLLFGRLAWSAWHATKTWLKWVGGILSSLFTLAFAVLIAAILVGFYRMNVSPYQYSDADVSVAMTPEQVAIGERYAHGCAGCHSTSGTLPLDGSKDNFLEGSPMGTLYAPNLTPAGSLKDWTDAEITRAIREGVDKDGRPLVIMPSPAFHNLSDADVQAIVAYLRSQPAVEHTTPERDLTVVAAAFLAVNPSVISAQPAISQPVVAPQPGSAEYGGYLVRAMGCGDCHGPNLAGQTDPGGPPGPNLTVIVPNWSEEDFTNVFNKGIAPSGDAISDEMPWKDYRQMFTDEQLKDLYTYLHGLTPVVSSQ